MVSQGCEVSVPCSYRPILQSEWMTLSLPFLSRQRSPKYFLPSYSTMVLLMCLSIYSCETLSILLLTRELSVEFCARFRLLILGRIRWCSFMLFFIQTQDSSNLFKLLTLLTESLLLSAEKSSPERTSFQDCLCSMALRKTDCVYFLRVFSSKLSEYSQSLDRLLMCSWLSQCFLWLRLSVTVRLLKFLTYFSTLFIRLASWGMFNILLLIEDCGWLWGEAEGHEVCRELRSGSWTISD